MAAEEKEAIQPNALAEANNQLSMSLHRLLAEEKGNVFFSPFSISTAMAMLLCGAQGTTEAEMRAALGYDHAGIKKEDIAPTFERQMSALSRCPDSYSLACANCMLYQKGFSVKDQYKFLLTESFRALLLEVDFQAEMEEAVSRINSWICENTKNMIPKLVSSLDPDTDTVLLNAVYFKGTWLYTFKEQNTCKQKFYNQGSENNSKEVDMMHITSYFLFKENESYESLQLSYVGEEVAMLILLPRAKNGLESLEASLTTSFFEDFKNSVFRKRRLAISVPKLHLEYSKSLMPNFKRLGVNRVFRQGAELRVMSDSSNLAVSDIFHKAVLDVNEEGSEAAAVMSVTRKCGTGIPDEFVVDHPFIFTIFDTRSDLILFMGRVEEL